MEFVKVNNWKHPLVLFFGFCNRRGMFHVEAFIWIHCLGYISEFSRNQIFPLLFSVRFIKHSKTLFTATIANTAHHKLNFAAIANFVLYQIYCACLAQNHFNLFEFLIALLYKIVTCSYFFASKQCLHYWFGCLKSLLYFAWIICGMISQEVHKCLVKLKFLKTKITLNVFSW